MVCWLRCPPSEGKNIILCEISLTRRQRSTIYETTRRLEIIFLTLFIQNNKEHNSYFSLYKLHVNNVLLKNVQLIQGHISVLTVPKLIYLPEGWGNVLSLTNKHCSPERKKSWQCLYVQSHTTLIQYTHLMSCVTWLYWICVVFEWTYKHWHYHNGMVSINKNLWFADNWN